MLENSVAAVRASVPEEFLEEYDQWVYEVTDKLDRISKQVGNAMKDAPSKSRKEFAKWALSKHGDLAPYLFARLDNRPIDQMIVDREVLKPQ